MTFRQNYAESQSDLTILTPSEGKKLYIWHITLESDNTSSLSFVSSGNIIVNLLGSGAIGANNLNKIGNTDEAIKITCGTNTTINILYDEVD